MTIEELKELISKHEHENVELKEWKSSVSVLGQEKLKNRSRCILGYCVALGHEGGGFLILGVSDAMKVVGTSTKLDLNKAKKQVFDQTSQKIEIEKITVGKKKVIIFKIPSRKSGELLKFAGVPLMRVGESIEIMSDEEQRKILLEHDTDFSAQIVPALNMNDLDKEALAEMKKLYDKKNNTDSEISQLLVDLGLQNNRGITCAALILLGKSNSLREYLANTEIIFQYRNQKNDIEYQDRVDYRNAFLLVHSELWDKIASRNQITQIQEGFLTKEIPSFNEKVIKEAILNAITHRDYRDKGSVIIKQSPQEFEIQSPGGFLPGITPENVLEQTKPRNRLIAEVLQHLGFVQRAGQGMDTIFRECILEGKGFPRLSDSDTHKVTLKIPVLVKNIAFLKYLERIANDKQITLSSLHEIIMLQEIEQMGKKFHKEDVKKFLDIGIVEQVGKTRGSMYLLSHNYYKNLDKTGSYTRLKGLPRDVKKQLIIEHLKKNKEGASLGVFVDAFPEMNKQDISNLLQELKKDNCITKGMGNTRGTVWVLIR